MTASPRPRATRAHPAIARRRSRVRRAAHGRLGLRIAGAAALAAFGYWLAVGPLMTVSGVTLSGYPGPDPSRVTALIDQAASRGGSLLAPPVGDIRRAAQADPWIKDVIVSRDLPTGIVVQVVPARPVAVGVPRAGAPMLVSRDGRSMGPVPPGTTLGRIAVPSPATLPLGAALPKASRAPVAFIAALPEEDAARVRGLTVRHGLVEGRLTRGPQLRAGTPGNMAAKAAALSAVLAQVNDSDQRAAQYVDVSVPDHPALGGPNADPTITRGTREQPRKAPATAQSVPSDPAAPTATTPATPAPAATPQPGTATGTPAVTPNAGQTSTSTTQ